ncbi:PREDICTED: uncharacterized protein LOC109227158 isoform X1 [Nicotiana attenuata]|uniref:Cystatin domain-containing protein n=1 Tax=Nicotiana attenuata TaxID=49451 RepID=A0A1J6IXK8_NICAT|nr:PREDICTED: uncharacterized protein LOC109227158 isoform X1 [Nicotiana attenuata]OIT02439.1 hypothetical protein A4A49_14775 [Nicotiana attenuata]
MRIARSGTSITGSGMRARLGFDISVHPGASFMASIAQLRSYLKNPKEKQIYTELCNLVIGIFNSQNPKEYEFVEIVKVNASFAAGTWFYFTFQARDTDDAVKIFQALVWDGINGTRKVEFCRLKKFIK